MSAASCLLTEDQFLCSICLDVFTDPVSTPCGHNFCKNCITQHWDIKVPCQCPVCKQVFYSRPELRVNTFISQMAAQFRQSAQQEACSRKLQSAKPGEVPCDVCTGTKLKALKSCLVCLVSYCETHLEPHLTVPALKSHQLIEPVENLEDRLCKKHNKPLELFCKNDQVCVCMLCTVLDHKTHDVVTLKDAHEGKKAEVVKTEAKLQQMIQERQLKTDEFRHSVKFSSEDADRKKATAAQIFTTMRQFLERCMDVINETTEEKQRATEKQAEGFITELEQEIFTLTKRCAVMKQLLLSEDDLDFLQRFLSLNAAPPTKDWTKVRILPPLYEGTMRIAVVRLLEQSEESIEQITEEIDKLVEAELKKVQQYAVDVTLDPDTAHPNLILSDDGKQVKHGDVKKNLPDNPERFSLCYNVLGKHGFSSGRFYFEVQVEGKTEWEVGVARQSINKKGEGPLSPQQGYWAIGLENEIYTAHDDPLSHLSVESEPEKVGVFVDYEEGLVWFYNVDEAKNIYSFTDCSFTEKLYPFFSPGGNDGGKNSNPLIITPVSYSE